MPHFFFQQFIYGTTNQPCVYNCAMQHNQWNSFSLNHPFVLHVIHKVCFNTPHFSCAVLSWVESHLANVMCICAWTEFLTFEQLTYHCQFGEIVWFVGGILANFIFTFFLVFIHLLVSAFSFLVLNLISTFHSLSLQFLLEHVYLLFENCNLKKKSVKL